MRSAEAGSAGYAGAASGLAAPLLWAATVAVSGALEPGYRHSTQLISELGARGANTAPLMSWGAFWLPGALLILFSVLCLWRAEQGAMRLGIVLLILVAGFARIASGVFPCDATCTPVSPTLSQKVHNLSAVVSALALVVAAAWWGYARPGLDRYVSWTCAAVGLLGLVLVGLTLSSRNAVGVFQRISLIAVHSWVLYLAFWHSRINSRQDRFRSRSA